MTRADVRRPAGRALPPCGHVLAWPGRSGPVSLGPGCAPHSGRAGGHGQRAFCSGEAAEQSSAWFCHLTFQPGTHDSPTCSTPSPPCSGSTSVFAVPATVKWPLTVPFEIRLHQASASPVHSASVLVKGPSDRHDLYSMWPITLASGRFLTDGSSSLLPGFSLWTVPELIPCLSSLWLVISSRVMTANMNFVFLPQTADVGVQWLPPCGHRHVF